MTTEAEQVEYCLEGGGVVSYAYSPGSSILKLILDMVDSYGSQTEDASSMPHEVYVRTDLFAALRAQLMSLPMCGDDSRSMGSSQLIISTSYRRVAVRPVPRLRWPLFYGHRREYDNSVINEAFERIFR